MKCSRKEFIRSGFISFGRELLATAAGGGEPTDVADADAGPIVIDQRRCLARVSGCFACIDHCPSEAIDLSRGGLSVDGERCNRCGLCASVCPLLPPAITITRDDSHHPSPSKGGRV